MKEQAKILIVDDRPANLIALDALLSQDEHTLITADSGAEALQVLEEETIDLIVLDVQMPRMDGFDLAKVLKSREDTAEIPILFVSAERLDRSSLMTGLREGAIDYLLKPLDPDITRAKVAVLLELQRRQKLLREKNAQLEKSAMLINHSFDILGVVDAQTLLIEEFNPAFYAHTGTEIGSAPGQSFLSFFDDADAAHVRAISRNASNTLAFETCISSRGGETACIEWKVVIRHGKWYVNGRDVTEVKDLQARLERHVVQLEATNRELETFSYTVSHDLRAPLRALNGSAVILEEDFPVPPDAMKYLRRIRENTLRMDTLINELLTFSRISKKELSKTDLDMQSMVTQLLDEIAESHSHQAEIRVGELPPAFGDYNMVRQVWSNLITNAIKYSSTRSAPVVEIGATNEDGNTEYFVRDNGVGFDMAYADRLFGTFQRLHDDTEFEGTGIGLAIVQRIVLKHGGSVRAWAEPEKGATFWFRL